ncbi:MAG: trigger factor [Pseudonocardiales bacterium]|nr:trigger factor [Pseudonocardiales bacterium]
MKSTVENLSPTRVRLAVEVPFEELKPSLDAAYKQLGAQLRVPGFRPGKVPARVIDQRVGRGAVLEQAVNEALPRAYGEAAREHDLRPIGQPDIDVADAGSVSADSPLHFTAEVDVRPQIDVPDFSGLAVTVDDVEVSDAEVDEQLEALRARFGTLTGVERPAQVGDFVSLDLVATVDGEEVDAGSARGLSYEVGADDLVDGLDTAVTGLSAGESAAFVTTLRQGERAGSEAEISVTVNSVKERELPAVDDEFAQLASEFDTADELRADLRARLVRVKELQQGAQARDRVLETLLDRVEFPVPESAITAEIEYREHDIVHSLGHDDALFDRYLSIQGKTREEYQAELRESAERSVRAQLLLDALADTADVQVGDAELTSYLVRQAARYEMAPQEFANQVIEAGNLPALVADVRRNKALADVLGSATITDSSGNQVDLSGLSAETLAEVSESDDETQDDLEAGAAGDDV